MYYKGHDAYWWKLCGYCYDIFGWIIIVVVLLFFFWAADGSLQIAGGCVFSVFPIIGALNGAISFANAEKAATGKETLPQNRTAKHQMSFCIHLLVWGVLCTIIYGIRFRGSEQGLLASMIIFPLVILVSVLLIIHFASLAKQKEV